MSDGVAWHTPTIETGKFIVRTIKLPVSLLTHVGGALGMLSEDGNWFEVGDPVADIIKLVTDMIDYWYTQDMIGVVLPFAGTIPAGYALLDGSTLDADLYPELAAVVPASWLAPITGDINLPDMTARSIVGAGTSYDLGDVGGSETHTLTIDEIPSHSHSYIPPVINVDVEAPGIPDPVAAGLGPSTSTGSAGNGQGHNNMPPYLIMNYAIFTGRHYD